MVYEFGFISEALSGYGSGILVNAISCGTRGGLLWKDRRKLMIPMYEGLSDENSNLFLTRNSNPQIHIQ